MDEIAGRGGALACIESGWFQDEIAQSAYAHALAVESGERVVIGVNRHRSDPEPIEVFRVDPAVEAAQTESLRAVREQRDGAAVAHALERLGDAAAAGENVLPACVEAVNAYATVGEIVGAIRAVHGAWREAVAR